nr:condensin complex subunit 2 [Tanacetum cinerariifolium]
MTEPLTPNNNHKQQQRLPVLSPDRPLFLGSNDDKLERAQARAARAAAIRRKQPTAARQATDSTDPPCLGQEQILELFQNCIKLASENENDVETNFQKQRSEYLQAGVRIYSMRVDSVHSEAYKVLGGISRVAMDSEQDVADDGNTDNMPGERTTKKEKEHKLSPLTTLESSFEALNVKKFD